MLKVISNEKEVFSLIKERGIAIRINYVKDKVVLKIRRALFKTPIDWQQFLSSIIINKPSASLEFMTTKIKNLKYLSHEIYVHTINESGYENCEVEDLTVTFQKVM